MTATREEVLKESFRRMAAEKRVLQLESHIEELNQKVQRLNELLESSRGQCARLIDDNKKLRAEREQKGTP